MKKLISTTLALLGLALFTSCGDPNKNPEPQPPVNNGLQLVTSERYVKADGAASVKFTVMHNGADVTSTAKIVNYRADGSVTLSTPSFSTKEVGEHQLYAIHDGVSSDKIIVNAMTSFPKLPVDAMPTKYDAFKKRAVASQFTSTGCVYCPRLIKAMHDYKATEDADNVVYVGCRFGFRDPFETEKAVEMAQAYGSMSLPFITFGMSKKSENQSKGISTADEIRFIVDKMLGIDAASAIAVATEVVSGKVCVSAEVKIAKQGNYMIGAMLVEDSLFAKQDNATGLKEDYFDTHNYALRAAAPSKKGVLNEQLGGKSLIKAQTKEIFCCEFDVAKSKVAKIENTRVIVFIYDMATAECDNIVSVKVGEELEYEYL